jgi:hypothetical protein
MSELIFQMWRDDMEISRGMLYGAELDQYVWKQRERWSIYGAVAGALVTNIFWLIAVGF